MFNITVLTLTDRIACFYSLSPFLRNTDTRYRFRYTDDPRWCLAHDRNEILIMMRQFIKPDTVDTVLLEQLRAKYKIIAFFHDDAGGGIPRLEVLPFVDHFYTKAIFRDRSLYSRQLYGKELYSDYYHTTYGVIDPDARPRTVCSDPAEVAKIKLSWNIGLGNYPRNQMRQRAGVVVSRLAGVAAARCFYSAVRFDPEAAAARNKGLYPVHARFGLISRPSINWQRKMILDRITANTSFLTGMVPQGQFNRETAHSKIVLSPFGWGELCLRDFEAIYAGSLLLKPDMSHLETWPDIFIPEETYVPFDWDASDLEQKASFYLENHDARLKIVRAAGAKYRADLDSAQDRFSAIMKEITQ